MKYLLAVVLMLPAFAEEATQASSATLARQPSTRPTRLPPPEVQRGDRVEVTVWFGAVHLQFDAETESSGHVGENVIVRNPENGRRFVAKVEEKGKVTIKK